MREMYDPSKQAVKTITPDGTVYDSGLEARFGMYAKTKLNMEFEYENNLAFIMEVCGGQYKPDYGQRMPDGSLSVIEVKGWKGARPDQVAKFMYAKVDDPGDEVSSYIFAWSKGIEIYDGQSKKARPAAFYKCPRCSEEVEENEKGWILPKDDHYCPECGTRCDYDCVNFNEAFNDWWREEHWGPIWKKWNYQWNRNQDAEQQSLALDKRFSDYLYKTYPELQLRRQSAHNKELSFLTRFAFDGSYIPEFWYTEPRRSVKSFGSALEPIVVVLVQDWDDNYRQALIKQLIRFVNDKGCPVVKLVHIDHDGIHVCDKYNSQGFSDGGIYTCPECEKTFFASDDNHRCPCCDCLKAEKISK